MKKDRKNVLYKLGERFSTEDLMNADTSHEFSEEYENQKKKLLENVSQKDAVKRARLRKQVVAAAAGILILVVPSSVFAAKQIMSGFSVTKKQTNNYEYEMDFSNPEQNTDQTQASATDDTNKDANDSVHTFVQMHVNYMPEGFKESQNSSFKYALNGSWDSNQNVSIALVKIEENQVIKKNNAVDSKDIRVGDKEATIFYKNVTDEKTFDKDMMIYYKEYGYMVEIYAQVNITEDVMLQIAQGIDLTPCEEDVATAFSTYRYNTNAGSSATQKQGPDKVDESKMVSMNTPVVLKDCKLFYSSDLEYTVQDYELRDSIQGLSESAFGFDLSDVRSVSDQNGMLTGYIHKNIEKGDRVNTVDRVISEEHRDVKLVYVTLKVKNTSDQDVTGIKLEPQLCSMDEDYNVRERICEKASSEGFSVYCDIPTMYQENPDLYGSDRQLYGQRYSMKAGEEKTVHVAYIIDADKTDHMALFYNAYGTIDKAENGCIIKLEK